jgi:hypothetical protein
MVRFQTPEAMPPCGAMTATVDDLVRQTMSKSTPSRSTRLNASMPQNLDIYRLRLDA